ncbi:putative COMM domain containing 5 [Blattamonas nauphoetae]|uniref:COMM domain-containing protein 5 n=1 Tax=Blattamonas nauphoetae TaxID=2049346 RepID=A0ABQ9Y4X1_9EUKA|nr:putative COMM domain containing 5 [Blattamonas nauphoetae]
MDRHPEIKRFIGMVGNIPQQKQWRELLQTTLNHHRNRDTFGIEPITKLRDSLGLSEDVFSALYTGMFCLIGQMIRNHTRKGTVPLETALAEELQPLALPEKYAKELISGFTHYEKSLTSSAYAHIPHHPSIEQFRWRTEVTISTSSVNRILKPSILIELRLTNGRKQLLSLNMNQFHHLRYIVAVLLKQMADIENDELINRDVKILPGVTEIV